jgi:hypothetical protein
MPLAEPETALRLTIAAEVGPEAIRSEIARLRASQSGSANNQSVTPSLNDLQEISMTYADRDAEPIRL